MDAEITSMERIMAAMEQREADRVPLCLALTYQGAAELDMALKNYFGKVENIVKGQLIMKEKYKNDCLNPFYYAAIESEAFGGEMVFLEDGPINSGEPPIKNDNDIIKLVPPSIDQSAGMQMCLKSIELLRKEAGPDVLIPGAVISPFSLPILQMGFDKYIELIYEKPQLFKKLMKVNEEFCVNWANAQLKAGASAISYNESMAAPAIIPTNIYEQLGFEVTKSTIQRIHGDIAIVFSSETCLPLLDYIIKAGAKMVNVGYKEDIGEFKKRVNNRLTVAGNLNGVEMCRWSEREAEEKVKDIISKAGRGGGLIISDSAGDIPYYVKEDTLLAISETINKWGKYPLEWIE